jgi:hypothetical protein
VIIVWLLGLDSGCGKVAPRLDGDDEDLYTDMEHSGEQSPYVQTMAREWHNRPPPILTQIERSVEPGSGNPVRLSTRQSQASPD